MAHSRIELIAGATLLVVLGRTNVAVMPVVGAVLRLLMKRVMRTRLMFGALVACLAATPSIAAHVPLKVQEPVGVIVDTDIWSDVDDVLALAMVHALVDRGELRLLGVTIGTEARSAAEYSAAEYVDLLSRFYGHCDIPIGMVRGGITPEFFNSGAYRKFNNPWSPNGIHYTQYVAQLKGKDGSLRFPSDIAKGDVPDAVESLRKMLMQQPDQSVVLIQLGTATNFSRLLESGPDRVSALPGRDLIRQKVRLLTMMAGDFQENSTLREFNIVADLPAARALFVSWPTPIVANGGELGLAMRYPGAAMVKDFNYVDHHPVAEAYRYVSPHFLAAFPKILTSTGDYHDHATHDLITVLHAIRPDRGYFSLSDPGEIQIRPSGETRFEKRDGGAHRYLYQSEDQRVRALEAMTLLVSQPPRSRGCPG